MKKSHSILSGDFLLFIGRNGTLITKIRYDSYNKEAKLPMYDCFLIFVCRQKNYVPIPK